jgi:hypothetical protein
MHLTHIEGKNIKGRSFAHQLAPVTAFVGDNFTGKTARGMAIRLALTGNAGAPIPKTPAGTWEALSNGQPVVSVTAKASDGAATESWSMTWTKNNKGTVSKSGSVPAHVALPDLLADPESFFSLTKEARAQMILACAGGIAVDYDLALATVKEWPMPGSVADTLKTNHKANLSAFLNEHGAVEGVAKFIEYAKTLEKHQKIEAERLTATITGSASVVFADAPPTKEQLEAAGAKLKALQDQENAALHDQGDRHQATEIVAQYQDDESTNGAKPNVEELRENIKVLEGVVEFSENRVNEARETQHQAQKNHDEAQRELAAASATTCPTCGQEKPKAGRKDLKEAKATAKIATDTLELAKAGFSQSLDELELARKKLANMRVVLSSAERAIAAQSQSKTKLENAIRLLAKPIVRPPEPGSLEAASNEYEALAAKRGAYEQSLKARTARDKAESELIRVRCDMETSKLIREAITAHVAQKTEAAFNSILENAGAFTEGLLRGDIRFDDGELVMEIAGQGVDVPWQSWSGTERLLAFAGLAFALCQEAKLKVIIFDEFGRLAPRMKVDVINRMIELTHNGVVSNCIVMDANADDYSAFEDDRLLVVNLNEEESK